MRHVENASIKFANEVEEVKHKFLSIENIADVKGITPIVKFTIQSDPIGEVGINGLQALDLLIYTKCLFQSLNDSFPCRENA